MAREKVQLTGTGTTITVGDTVNILVGDLWYARKDLERMIRDDAAVVRILADLRDEHRAWMEEGAARERQEILRIVDTARSNLSTQTLTSMMLLIQERGPILPRLTPDEIAAALEESKARVATLEATITEMQHQQSETEEQLYRSRATANDVDATNEMLRERCHRLEDDRDNLKEALTEAVNR